MDRIRLAALGAALSLALCGMQARPAAGAEAQKKSKNPVDAVLAIYVPEAESEAIAYIPQLNAAFAPGKALRSAALLDVQSQAAAAAPSFNLILALHSTWETKDRTRR